MMHPDEQKELVRRKCELQLQQMIVDQKTADILKSSIISNLTLSDFEIVTNEDLGINFWSKCSENYNNYFSASNTLDVNDTYQYEQSESGFVVRASSQTELNSNNLLNCINIERNGIFQISAHASNTVSDKLEVTHMSLPIDICAIEQRSTAANVANESNPFSLAAMKSSMLINDSEKSLIYSLKNGHKTESKMSLSSVIENLKNGNSAAPNYNHIHMMVESVQKLTQFVSKKVFGAIFNDTHKADETTVSVSEHNDDNDDTKLNQPKFNTFDECQLSELNTIECKKLLMQLFEIALGVMLCEYKDRKAGIYPKCLGIYPICLK